MNDRDDESRLDPGELSGPGDGLPPDLVDTHDAPVSPLELLRRAAEEKVEHEDLTWKVPNRQGLAVRYTVEGLDPRRMEKINRAAADDTGRISQDTVHCLVLAHQCTGLLVDGTLVTDRGRPLRFSMSAVLAYLGVDSAADAVRVFYGGPTKDYGFHVMGHANELQIEAGVTTRREDDDGDDEDPTPAIR